MKKVLLKKIVSKLGLLPVIEQLNFLKEKRKNSKSNALFLKENPNVILPPDFYLYETFNMNYKSFYTNGIPTAKWILDFIKEFKELKNIDRATMMSVLEDVFRNLLLKNYGTDENFDIILNIDKGDLEVWRNREIVENGEVEDENSQIELSEAVKIEPDFFLIVQEKYLLL